MVPLATNLLRCKPVTWFTPYSGHMVNTLSGANGEGPGSTRSLFFVEVPQIILQEADLPDVLVDFAYADELAGEHRAQVYLASSEADAAAASDELGAIVEGVFRIARRLIGPR